MYTLEAFKKLVPKNQASLVTQEFLNKINQLEKDPMMVEIIKENLINYVDVLKTGKFKLEDYRNAIIFVSHKLLGDSDTRAYAKTFPERYGRMVQAFQSEPRRLSSYVHSYKSGKLVQTIIEQTLVPTYIANAPARQQMINELIDIAINGKSEIARVNAASKVIDITTIPEATKIELNMGLTDEAREIQNSLNDKLSEIALNQQKLFQAGIDLDKIQKLQIKHSDNSEEDVVDV